MNLEYGSDFHLITNEKFITDEKESFFDEKRFNFFISGRSSLYSLLKNGIEKHNWKKVFLPSYYCKEVLQELSSLPLEIEEYKFNPFLDLPNKELNLEDKPKNALVSIDFFGLNKINSEIYNNLFVIEDLTHNLSSLPFSNADYVFASLRKELPVPCGGITYSPKSFYIPQGKRNELSNEVTFKKLTGMYLKKQYIEGSITNKEIFRELLKDGESLLDTFSTDVLMPEICYSIVKKINVIKLLKIKENNIKYCLKKIKNSNIKRVSFNLGKNKGMGLLLKFEEKEHQNYVRDKLIKSKIFPAVLWPEQTLKRDIDTQKTMLFIHTDFRYNKQDLDIIVKKLIVYIKEWKSLKY